MVLAIFEYALCLLALFGIVLWADRRFPVLRDIPVAPVVPGASHTALPYSLGRVQMAFWTIIVIGSGVYLYFFLPEHDLSKLDIDSSLAFLMGISGATGVMAAAVDLDKDKQVSTAQAGATSAAKVVTSLLASLPPAAAPAQPDPALVAQLAAKQLEQQLHESTIRRLRRSNDRVGFISDILTDENGNSLHRLQLVLFTLLFGSVLVFSVGGATHVLPAFNPNMLTLLGVSSAVYVGFKVPGRSS